MICDGSGGACGREARGCGQPPGPAPVPVADEGAYEYHIGVYIGIIRHGLRVSTECTTDKYTSHSQTATSESRAAVAALSLYDGSRRGFLKNFFWSMSCGATRGSSGELRAGFWRAWAQRKSTILLAITSAIASKTVSWNRLPRPEHRCNRRIPPCFRACAGAPAVHAAPSAPIPPLRGRTFAAVHPRRPAAVPVLPAAAPANPEWTFPLVSNPPVFPFPNGEPHLLCRSA